MPGNKKKLLIFLSHASEDKDLVRELRHKLKADGFDPWLDEERLLPGMDWDREIEQALEASDAILLCFSALSIAKEGYIQREYKRALRYAEEKPEGTIFNIPVRLDDCAIPREFRDLQYVDYPSGYARLVAALNQRSGQLAEAKPMPAVKKPAPAGQPAPQNEQPVAEKKKKEGKIVQHIGQQFNFNAPVSAGRDINYGDVTYHINETQYTIETPADFTAALQQVRAEMEKMKAGQASALNKVQARLLDEAAEKVETAIQKSQQPEPDAPSIADDLNEAKDTMDALKGALGSALALGGTLGTLAAIVMRLFGG